jgi:hypothetical protein
MMKRLPPLIEESRPILYARISRGEQWRSRLLWDDERASQRLSEILSLQLKSKLRFLAFLAPNQLPIEKAGEDCLLANDVGFRCARHFPGTGNPQAPARLLIRLVAALGGDVEPSRWPKAVRPTPRVYGDRYLDVAQVVDVEAAANGSLSVTLDLTQTD